MTDPNIESKADELNSHIVLLETWLQHLEEREEAKGRHIALHYTVVAAYGIIESEMKRMLNSLEEQTVSMNLATYRRKIDRKYQWDFEVIIRFLSMANRTLSEEVTCRLNTQQQESITSLRVHRNTIAHGDSFHSDFREIKEEFENSIDALYIISGIIQEANCPT